jgi:hypothetical protein
MDANEAAGEQKPEAYPPGYVEDFCEPRTKLAAIFSSRYSLTGMNCLIQLPNPPGLRLWI